MAFQPAALLVLENHDLLDLIFGFFDPYEKQALLWAALTSRSFSKPGLDKLWQHMNSLWPLCWLLPVLNLDSRTFDGFHDNLLDRVLLYARRIRFLRLDAENTIPFNDIRPNPDVFNRINELGAFHSLRELRIHSEPLDWLFPFRLSAPNLEVVEFHTYPKELPDSVSPSFLRATALESPGLKVLKIYTDTFSKATFDVLPHFRNLQHLRMNITDSDISINLLKHCSTSMTSLRSLMLCFIRLRFVDDLDRPVSVVAAKTPLLSSTFGSLSNLDVTGAPLNIQMILNVMRVPSLVNLRLSFCSYDIFDINPFVQSFMAFHRHLLKGRLRSLSLEASRSVKIDFVSYLTPFKAFEQLDTLHIDSGLRIPTSILESFDLRENEFLSNLTNLRLAYTDSNGLDNTLSIAALPLLADLCPKLLHLTIAIYNPDQTAIIKALSSGDDDMHRRSHDLETLAFCWMPQGWEYSGPLAFRFSAFLCSLFPGLNTVTYSSDIGFSHVLVSRTQWMKRVRELLKIHQPNAISGTAGSRRETSCECHTSNTPQKGSPRMLVELSEDLEACEIYRWVFLISASLPKPPSPCRTSWDSTTGARVAHVGRECSIL